MGSVKKTKGIDILIDEYNDIPDYMGYCPDCPVCGGTMGYSYGKSEFKCFECGTIFDEDDIESDEIDGIPWGCANCGGPYPLCTSSCKMFDE